MKEKIEKLLKQLKEKKSSDYEKAVKMIESLNEERIKFIGNDLRKFLGRAVDENQKDKIIAYVKELNKIAFKNNIDFQISEDFGVVEKLLRNTIMEDIGKEFQKQNN